MVLGRAGSLHLRLIFLATAVGCHEQPKATPKASAETQNVVARYAGGVITEDAFQKEARKLPADLRKQFQSPVGERELLRSMVDKELLFQEAERRGFTQDAEIRRQVHELEERLSIQALLSQEEKAAGPATDAELRTYYEAHRKDFAEPERLHLARLLVRVAPEAGAKEKKKAKERADSFARRLARGEALATVGLEGDGPERARAGDVGLVAPGDLKDEALEKAAFALQKPGEATGAISCRDGFAVLSLIERRPARTPPFEEVRSQIVGKMTPLRQRKVFDELISKLRRNGDVVVGVAARQ